MHGSAEAIHGRRSALTAIGVAVACSLGVATSSQAAVPTTVRASVASGGAQSHRAVTLAIPGISDDGRYVLMTSAARRLVAGDTNAVADAFLRDTTGGTTARVSVSSSGHQGNGASTADALSPDGRFVLLTSRATNLSVAPDTNGVADVFLRDRRLGITRRVSIPVAGGQFSGPSSGVSVSANGRFVLFTNTDPHHPQRAYVRDRVLGTTIRIGRMRRTFDVEAAGISANGRMLAYVYLGDKTGTCNVVIHDRATGRTVDTSGLPGWSYGCCGGPVLFTPDGGSAVFTCPTALGGGPLAVVLWTPGAYTQVTGSGADAFATGISDDGQEVSFVSADPALVAGDTNARDDLFRVDLGTHAAGRLDLSAAGAQVDAGVADDPFGANGGELSGDGRFAAFESQGGTVVAGDTNGVVDVFLRGPLS